MDFLFANHVAALFLTAATSFIVGLFVLAKSRGNYTNKVYVVWSLSVAWWSFFEGLMITADSYSSAVFFSRMLWVSVLFIAVSTAHFVTLFLGVKGKGSFIKVGYVFSSLFAAASFMPRTLWSIKQIAYIKYFTSAGIFIYLNALIFAVYVVYQICHLDKARRFSRGIRRKQIVFVFWASLLGYAGGLSNYLLTFGVYIPIVHPFATYLVILYPTLVALAILKYHLMDIRVVIKKTFLYSAVVVLVGGAILAISFLSNWFARNIPVFGLWIMPLSIGTATFIIGKLYWQKSKQVEESYEIEKKAHGELKRLNEVKDEFILATQHHLRTPLSIIKGYLAVTGDLLAKKDFNKAEVKEYLDKAASSADRLTSLVNELLNITQMEIGKEPFSPKAANLKDIIEEVIAELQPEIRKKNLSVKIVPEKGWPKLLVDPKKIKMALFNLIDNSIKYTKEGSIAIAGKKRGGFFQISVKDTGIGINPSDIGIIFTKYFERGKRAKTLNATGRGIGLYVAASAIRGHKGRVYAKSDGINRGSEFVVELPMEQ